MDSRIFKCAFFSALLTLTAISCQDNPFTQGERLYDHLCANCHMDTGEGLQNLIPPLAGSEFVRDNVSGAACIIRYGTSDTITVAGRVFQQPMAGNPDLTEFEIANLVNYIRHAWGNEYGFVKLDEIKAGLEACRLASE